MVSNGGQQRSVDDRGSKPRLLTDQDERDTGDRGRLVEHKLPDRGAASSEFCCRKDWWESDRGDGQEMRVPASPETWTNHWTNNLAWWNWIIDHLLPFQFLDIFNDAYNDNNQLNDDYSKEGENSRVEELKNII